MLEKLNEYPVTTKTVDSFGGLDRRIKIEPNSFSDMNNFVSDDLPVIATRKKRSVVKDKSFLSASGMNEVNGDLYFFAKSISRDDGSFSLYKNTDEITSRSFDSQKKITAVMGADIIIFPDKLKYSTLSGEFEPLVKTYSSAVEISLCDSLYKTLGSSESVKGMICLDETEIKSISVPGKSGEKAVNDVLTSHAYSSDSIILYCPALSVFKSVSLSDGLYSASTDAVSDYDGKNDSFFYDLRDGELYIKKKDADGNAVYGKDISYLKIAGEGISSLFSQWDSVSVSSGGGVLESMYLNGEKTICRVDAESDCVYVSGVIDSAFKSCNSGTVTITREIPDMDLICAYENRLYGCRFKKAEGSSVDSLNEIYVSKLGEPDNFSLSDSEMGAYALSVGENGEFTAVCGYNGYVCFFKENCVILLDRYFSASVIRLDGVNIYGSKTTAQTDGKLIYTGTNGVYIFNGSSAVKVSEALGEFDIIPICACAYDGKYYLNSISRSKYLSAQSNSAVKEKAQAAALAAADERLAMSGINKGSLMYRVYLNLYKTMLYPFYLIAEALATFDESQMYVYDTVKNVWTKENVGSVASCMTSDAGNVYYIDSKGFLYSVNPSQSIITESETEDDFEWYLVSGDIGYSINSKKYISRIGIRIKPGTGTVVNVDAQYDSSGKFTRLFTLRSSSDSAVTLPVIPVRCDHVKIRLSGTGEFSLLGAFADFEEGSEIL